MQFESIVKAGLVAALSAGLLAGCSQLERLTIIRPSAHIRSTTQVAPTYDVSGRHGRNANDAYTLLAAASDYYQKGQYDEAERTLHQALKVPAAVADANTLLGMIADARGQAGKAGKYYEAATAAAPMKGLYANNYGNWLCNNGQAAQSLVWFERALGDREYATPLVAFSNAGLCARKAGDNARAEQYWRAALGLDPATLPALAGMAQLEFDRSNFLDARAFTERWLALTPGDEGGLRLAAAVEQKLGDNVAASRYLSRLQAIPPVAPPVPATR